MEAFAIFFAKSGEKRSIVTGYARVRVVEQINHRVLVEVLAGMEHLNGSTITLPRRDVYASKAERAHFGRLVSWYQEGEGPPGDRPPQRPLTAITASMPKDKDPMKKWTSKPTDRSGLAAYTHLIRAADDPERMPRERKDGMAWRTDLSKKTEGAWYMDIHQLLRDGTPRTFNRIVLEVSGGKYTADVAFEKAPDRALWALVSDGMVEHTLAAPILFRLRRR